MLNNYLQRLLMVLITVCITYNTSNILADNISNRLLKINIETKNIDDALLANMASGLSPNQKLTVLDFQKALIAIQLTDRFKKVEGQLYPNNNGIVAKIKLTSWPKFKHIVYIGNIPKTILQTELQKLHMNQYLGNIALAHWSHTIQNKLITHGYPNTKVLYSRTENDRILTILAKQTGPNNTIKKINIIGNYTPFSINDIHRFAKINIGSLWTPVTQQKVFYNIKKNLDFHKYYEAYIDISWNENENTLVIHIFTGPKIILKLICNAMWIKNTKYLMPLIHSKIYSHGSLDECKNRLLSYFNHNGYMQTKVSYNRQFIYDYITRIQKVKIKYIITRGKKSYLNNIFFIGNNAFTNEELISCCKITNKQLYKHSLTISNKLLNTVEVKIKELYIKHGYTDISLHYYIENNNKQQNNLIYKIHEGQRKELLWLKLELPYQQIHAPWTISSYLTSIFPSNKNLTVIKKSNNTYIYYNKKSKENNIYGILQLNDNQNGILLELNIKKSTPFIKNNIVKLINIIQRQYLLPMGIIQPYIQLTLDNLDNNKIGIFIKIPPQTIIKTQRLIINGGSKTKAETIFKELYLKHNKPFNIKILATAQTNLNHLKILQHINTKDLDDYGILSNKKLYTYTKGNLKLILDEYSPYMINSALSYNKNQGCQLNFSLTQFNIGGMGKSIEYDIQVGNDFIRHPTLNRQSLNNINTKSRNMLTLTYTNPYFYSSILKNRLPNKTQFRTEMQFSKEYLTHLLYRLRITTILQLPTKYPELAIQIGHRLEHTNDVSTFSNNTISSPFVQISKDTRNNQIDPTNGIYSIARLEIINRLGYTQQNSTFIKMDFKNQFITSLSPYHKRSNITIGLHLGIIKKLNSSNQKIPYTERFFAGGPTSFRSVASDMLCNHIKYEKTKNPKNKHYTTKIISTGGNSIIIMNMEYKFPLIKKIIWGEFFLDSGQVYEDVTKYGGSLNNALGIGCIIKMGVPIKIEYAIDIRNITKQHKYRTNKKFNTKGIIVSAGFPF